MRLSPVTQARDLRQGRGFQTAPTLQNGHKSEDAANEYEGFDEGIQSRAPEPFSKHLTD